MLDIDAAVLRNQHANPPPSWWIFPDPEDNAATLPEGFRLDDYFPLTGHDGGWTMPPTTEVRFTDADIMEATQPGDRYADIARRLGCSGQYLSKRRAKYPELAAAMDAKLGRHQPHGNSRRAQP